MAYFLVELPDAEGSTFTPIDVAMALAGRGWHTSRVAPLPALSRSAVRAALMELTPVLDVTATVEYEGLLITIGVGPDGGIAVLSIDSKPAPVDQTTD